MRKLRMITRFVKQTGQHFGGHPAVVFAAALNPELFAAATVAEKLLAEADALLETAPDPAETDRVCRIRELEAQVIRANAELATLRTAR